MRKALIACSAIGCLAALFFPTPQQRFVAAFLGAISPITVYWLARLLRLWLKRAIIKARQHNWRQFGLRGLLAFTILCAIGSLIWSWTRPDIRYRRMREWQELATAVKLLGGTASNNGVSLNGQVIYDADLEMLASLPGAKGVYGINLNGTGVTDEVAKHLALFPDLRNVSMNGCLAITDEALTPLHENRTLRFLSVYDTQITHEGVKALQDVNHLMLVHWGNLNPVFVKGEMHEKANRPAPASSGH